MDADHKIEVAKEEEEKALKESLSARKAVKAKKKEKARTELAFDQGNLSRGIDKNQLESENLKDCLTGCPL